jgi:aldehyde dehydrogenase (NAD+)
LNKFLIMEELFRLQSEHLKVPLGYRERRKRLLALKDAVLVTYREAIRQALRDDFKKPQAETDLSEVFAVTSEIDHALRYLKKWMSDRYVRTPLAFFGSSSYVKVQPKGMCLIISPWNFPVNLSLGPLVSAVAAGNRVILKPSEFTPHSSAVIKEIVEAVFPPEEVAVVEGGVEASSALLALPFHHIFFTGSPHVGKIVMRAAAENLASVTLELGGKSPVIVDETADISAAARRIAWGKWMNAGQICIAPDYVFVHKSKEAALVSALKELVQEFYGEQPIESSSLSSIVNEKHADRLRSYLEDASALGATFHLGGESRGTRIAPALIGDLPMTAKLMQEEIFGPILPLIPYGNAQEVIQHIRQGEKPLAVYIFSKNEKNIQFFLDHTRAGGTCVNNSDMHFLQPYLPFGGDNNSGLGKAHGYWGFLAFSNERAVYRQHLPSVLEKLMPPYTEGKNRIIEWIVKWL